jgi:hypothetical protein
MFVATAVAILEEREEKEDTITPLCMHRGPLDQRSVEVRRKRIAGSEAG